MESDTVGKLQLLIESHISKLLKKIDEEQDGEIVSQGSEANIKPSKKVIEATADLVDGENAEKEGGETAEGGENKQDGEVAEGGEAKEGGETEVVHEEEDEFGE